MKKEYILFTILVIFSFLTACSCSHKEQELKGKNIISIDISHANSLDYREYFDSVRYIPLETKEESLIGEVTKLYFNIFNNIRYFI